MNHRSWFRISGILVLLVYSISVGSGPPRLAATQSLDTQTTFLPFITENSTLLTISLGQPIVEQGLYLDYGGDVDTDVVLVGNPKVAARRTGNGTALPAGDNNSVLDFYMQFRADDSVIFAGSPTTRLRIQIEYFDQGTDTFMVQYDSTGSGGPFGDGRFVSTAVMTKTDTQQFKTAVFNLCDVYFANRDNGADFRIDDREDGAEIIRHVSVIPLAPGPVSINVDVCGANPWDTNPDSQAIQSCIDRACNGDTITFTSGVSTSGYQGYQIDKTIFLVTTAPRHDLTFTSSDPSNNASLNATAGLKGFVVRLLARSRIFNQGEVDDVTVSHLDLDGGRSLRRCFGSDGIEDGLNDNWGSWLPECSEAGDPWCRAGTLAMDGSFAGDDATQNYLDNPTSWTTGLLVKDVNISNTECGTGLSLFAAASTIQDSVITTGGDHVHRSGCTQTDNDEGVGAWSDGLTLMGPGLTITDNVVTDVSDVGIVFFGGKDTVIASNIVQANPGNHGMFAAIAIHPWGFGDISGLRVVDNLVNNSGSTTCGGMHVGINIGPQMWGAGCVSSASPVAVGNPNQCLAEPSQPSGTLCPAGSLCQEWAHVAAGKTLTMTGNIVTGAQVNYLIEGLDLLGTLIETNNTSHAPRTSDWYAAQYGCKQGSLTTTWGTIDKAAHHPSLSGWVDQRIHCER